VLERSIRRTIIFVLVSVVVLCGSRGCTYLRHRAEDATEMIEVGFTWTRTPYFSAYACGGGVATAGIGRVDGQFVGVGGSQVGVTPHYHKILGLVAWSYEEIGWGEFDPADPDTLERHHVGPLGWLLFPQRRPAYAPG